MPPHLPLGRWLEELKQTINETHPIDRIHSSTSIGQLCHCFQSARVIYLVETKRSRKADAPPFIPSGFSIT